MLLTKLFRLTRREPVLIVVQEKRQGWSARYGGHLCSLSRWGNRVGAQPRALTTALTEGRISPAPWFHPNLPKSACWGWQSRMAATSTSGVRPAPSRLHEQGPSIDNHHSSAAVHLGVHAQPLLDHRRR
jgi:hypothetical protein